MDRTRLLSNLDLLFPGAYIDVADTGSEVSAPKQSAADKLLAILSQPGLPDILTTQWISKQIGKPWRKVWKHILPLADVQRAIANLGWRYVPRPGRPRKGEPGSTFERLPRGAFAPLPQFQHPLDIMLGVAGRAEAIASGAGSSTRSSSTTALAA
jgi:hypothetical protein